MKYTKFFTFLFLVFALASCDFGSTTTDKPNLPTGTLENGNAITDATKKPTMGSTETADNWLVIPGKQVGRIQVNTSFADLEKLFGANNVMKSEIGLGEGEMTNGVIIFPNTQNELEIIFVDDTKMNQIKTVRIEGDGAKWTTDNGIATGTTLEELVKINGKDFKFYGFEWDYAGKLASWEDGKISDKLSVYLEATNEEAIFPALLGDGEFSSDNPKAKEGRLEVISLSVDF